MNIQFSVVIWTVICFLVLMAVLKFLLFTPVIELLDKRKEKINNARLKKEKEAEIIKEHEIRLAIIEEDKKIQQENLIKSELELIRVKNKQDTEDAKVRRLERTKAYINKTEKEKEDIRNTFISSSDKIVKAFADRLISQ